MSLNKFTVNTGVAFVAFTIGTYLDSPTGLFLSVGYFTVDNYYPRGWSQALKDRSDREKEVQRIIPSYQKVPYGPKW